MIDRAAVTAALEAAGLEVSITSGDYPNWKTTFLFDGKPTPVFMLLPTVGSYFIIFSPVLSANWPPATRLEHLDTSLLRDLIRANSSTRLAKVEWHEDETDGFFVVTSECSTENYTGEKMRRRMEACGSLAFQVQKFLTAYPPKVHE